MISFILGTPLFTPPRNRWNRKVDAAEISQGLTVVEGILDGHIS
jgi:hypothetical protein